MTDSDDHLDDNDDNEGAPEGECTIKYLMKMHRISYKLSHNAFLSYFIINILVYASCSNTYDENSRTINSPNYPNQYPNSKRCAWKITAPIGAKIKLGPSTYSLEPNNECRYDYLDIYDGPNTSSDRKARLCNQDLYELISTTNSLYLEFNSDGSGVYDGFQFSYSFIGIYIDPNSPSYTDI